MVRYCLFYISFWEHHSIFHPLIMLRYVFEESGAMQRRTALFFSWVNDWPNWKAQTAAHYLMASPRQVIHDPPPSWVRGGDHGQVFQADQTHIVPAPAQSIRLSTHHSRQGRRFLLPRAVSLWKTSLRKEDDPEEGERDQDSGIKLSGRWAKFLYHAFHGADVELPNKLSNDVARNRESSRSKAEPTNDNVVIHLSGDQQAGSKMYMYA